MKVEIENPKHPSLHFKKVEKFWSVRVGKRYRAVAIEVYEAMEIRCKYVVDDKNRKIAVHLNIETFEKIEEVLENYGLVQLMSDEEENEEFDINKAKDFYKNLEKASAELDRRLR